MADPFAGKTIDRYQIVSQLGEGGMATVYKAFDTRLERYIALKLITTNLQNSRQFLQRFEREAKALAKLSHPNIVKVHDYGEEDGRPYLIMEFIDGGNLKSKMGSPHSFQEAAKLLMPIASALGYAHKRDIVHRDVKPANILMQLSGVPMLSDFGIAKVLESDQPQLTKVGVGIGTPEYMAPEQGQGNAVDHRADIYSLGLVLYELVTGRKPFQADTPMAIVWKQVTEPLPDPRKFVPSLPPAVVAILQKALQKKPEDRYQTMEAFSTDLEKISLIGVNQPASTRSYEAIQKAPTPSMRPATQGQPWQQNNNTGDRLPSIQQPIYTTPTQPPPSQQFPQSPPQEPAKKKGCWIWIIAGSALVAVILCGIIAIWLGIPDDLFGLSTQTPTPSSTPLPTETPTEAPTATPEPTQTEMPTLVPTWTPVVDQSQPSDDPWQACIDEVTHPIFFGMSVLYCDNFTTNNGWFLDPTENDYKIHERYFSEDMLFWDITSKQSVMTYERIPDLNGYTEFAAQASFKRVSGPDNSDAGLLFRMNYDSGDYYFITVADASQQYAFYLKKNGEWTTFRDWTYTSTVHPGDWNKIGVYGNGGSFDLYINDIYIESFYDETLPSGEIGIGVELYDSDENIVFSFDNVMVLIP